MHEVPVNRRAGLSLPRKSVVRLTDRPDMTLDVYRGRQTTMQQQQQQPHLPLIIGIFVICLYPVIIHGWVRKPPCGPNVLNHCRSCGRGFGSSKTRLPPPPPPSYLLLTVPRQYLCWGSSVLHVMFVCIWSLAIW